MKIIEVFVAKDGRFFEDETLCLDYESTLTEDESPYLYSKLKSISQEKSFNPKYDSDSTCDCGHAYYRHFDPYENNDAVGCKHCQCHHFKLAR